MTETKSQATPISFMRYIDKAEKRKALIFMAQIAEGAERYDDMCKFVRAAIAMGQPLSAEERTLLSTCFKNLVGQLRASLRSFHNEDKYPELMEEYRRKVEGDLLNACSDVLDLLENILTKMPNQQNDAKVFYLKMTGDYYRYLAEFQPANKSHAQKAASYYKTAFKAARETLEPTDPIRLGLALNYSVCFYEILKDKARALELAKSAFDAAIAKLDDLDELSYKDSTLIMQLLRDNLTLWTSADNQQQQQQQQGQQQQGQQGQDMQQQQRGHHQGGQPGTGAAPMATGE